MGSTTIQTDLATLAGKINEHHRQAEAAAVTAIQHARAAGDLLAEAKAQCRHGDWLPWLEEHFEGSARMAQRYMLISANWPALEAKYDTMSHLPIRQAIKLLEKPREKPASVFPCELRSDAILRCFGKPDSMAEVRPSAEYPGYYHLECYQQISTDTPDVTYLRRPARLTRDLVRSTLRNMGFEQTTEWMDFPMETAEPETTEPYYALPAARI